MGIKQSSDVLFAYANNKCYWYHDKRIVTPHTHGAGCTLSSAISCFLAKGLTLTEAVFNAKQYLCNAIQSGSVYQLGVGCGPVNHFYHLQNI